MGIRKPRLGDKVEDKVTGFEGTVVAKINYLNGCTQCQVQPKVNEKGEIPKTSWIDEPQLKIVVKDPEGKVPPKGGGMREHPNDE